MSGPPRMSPMPLPSTCGHAQHEDSWDEARDVPQRYGHVLIQVGPDLWSSRWEPCERKKKP